MTGLTGRPLTLNSSWVNPKNEWRLGAKRAAELYPSKLKSRLAADAKKDWDKSHGATVAAAMADAAEHDLAHPSPKLGTVEHKTKTELKERVSQLKSLKHDYAGPMLDVVCWHDGKTWRAAVSPDGDFSKLPGMSSYREDRQWASFGDDDLFNYCVTIYQDGEVVSICVASGAHGTHVAGIIGMY